MVSGGLSNLLHTMSKYTFLTVGFIAKYAGVGKYHMVLYKGSHCAPVGWTLLWNGLSYRMDSPTGRTIPRAGLSHRMVSPTGWSFPQDGLPMECNPDTGWNLHTGVTATVLICCQGARTES